MRTLLTALRMSLATLILCGVAYPLVVTGLSRLIFPHQAEGSLVTDDKGDVIGSELIAQPFSGAAYFHPRPSAAGERGWDPQASGGTNLSPTSAKLREHIAAERARLARENPEAPGPAPDELVTASASGLDPHISPETAAWQLARVARARGVAASRVAEVVEQQTEERDLAFLGERRVNVLLLNLALDRQFGRGPS